MTNNQSETAKTVQEVEQYKKVIGNIINTIPDLLKEGRTPITTKQLIEARLNALEEDKRYLTYYPIDTALAIIPNPTGEEIKYVHNHPLIFELNTTTQIIEGSLPISQEDYESHEGFILTSSQVKRLQNAPYSLPKIRKEFWEFAVEGDTTLATDYEKHVFRELNSPLMQFEDEPYMGLWIPENKGLRMIQIGSINLNYGFSDAYANDIGPALLIGVKKSKTNSKCPSLDNRL